MDRSTLQVRGDGHALFLNGREVLFAVNETFNMFDSERLENSVVFAGHCLISF
jgi:hypothetical protein